MEIELPPIKLVPLRNEVDRFGFSFVLSNKFGMSITPRSFACYLHGWVWRKDLRLDDLRYYDTPRNTPIVVATKFQKKIMLQNDFTNVTAGGLPFAYISNSHINRRLNSLLIMPPHSMEISGYSGINSIFLDFIQSIVKDFSEVCFCLHYDDAKNREVIENLSCRGFKYIIGAHSSDGNSLIRMRQIFDYYDYVTTTTMGSHILYAAFCGCKVSLLKNHFTLVPKASINSDAWAIKHPEFIERGFDTMNNIEQLKLQFPWLFTNHPKEAIEKIEWAYDEIGADNLLDKERLMYLLGWTVKSKIKALIRITLWRISHIFK